MTRSEEEIKQIKEKFIERTKKHIELVNKYANKVGYEFPDHDASKLDLLLDAYCYYVVPKEERSEEEQLALDMATLLHIKNASHHPEYWTSTPLEGFTRQNYTPNGVIDATEMDNESIVQMVADWNAMSEEKGNSPMEWFNKVNGKRWLFTTEQQRLIRNLIKKMWYE